MTTRWQSWHAAFEEAGKVGIAELGPGRLRLVLSAGDFALAMAAEHEQVALPYEVQQEACMSGTLSRWDARGRCVIIIREGSLKRAEPEGRIVLPPELEGAEVGSLGYAGNVAASAPSALVAPPERFEVPFSMPAGASYPPPKDAGIVAAVKSVLPKGKKK